MSRSSSMWFTQWLPFSRWPYIMVDVVKMPTLWAVRMTRIHCSVLTLFFDSTMRTSSSRISAAVPGTLSRPASRSMRR